tara:strand:- start:224 stop:1189 length:966 start_codon:yes stop_codon:yes gene_type:complete
MLMNELLNVEALAFDKRINERISNGFIPDLQKLKFNSYFYKSFWRDPLYADCFVGEMFRNFLKNFKKYIPNQGRILDMGCGSGYFSLELARNGYNVVGIDISNECIESAKHTLKLNKDTQNFGSLKYYVGSEEKLESLGKFDGILSSGFLHHCLNVEKTLEMLYEQIQPEGIIVMHEPQHNYFNEKDALVVGSIRELLARGNLWLENPKPLNTDIDFKKLSNEVKLEFTFERDVKEEDGQSPNDLSCDRDQILNAVKKKMFLVEDYPSASFIYRILGGLRGNKKVNKSLALFLTNLDKYFVDNKIINANYFYAVAKKNKEI